MPHARHYPKPILVDNVDMMHALIGSMTDSAAVRESSTFEIFGDYCETVAELCHNANKNYCETIGDHTQEDWDDAEEWQRKSAIAGVLYLLKEPGASAEMQHDAWCALKTADGWKFGEQKDAEEKTHPCLVPYAKLPEEQKAKDRLFQNIVRAFIQRG